MFVKENDFAVLSVDFQISDNVIFFFRNLFFSFIWLSLEECSFLKRCNNFILKLKARKYIKLAVVSFWKIYIFQTFLFFRCRIRFVFIFGALIIQLFLTFIFKLFIFYFCPCFIFFIVQISSYNNMTIRESCF